MTSEENNYSSPSNDLTINISSVMKDTDLVTEVPLPSTIITMTSDTSPSTSSVRSSKKNQLTDNHTEFSRISIQKKVRVRQISIINLRRRLCLREFFYARLALVSNIMCVLGILGIVLMIIENELTFTRIDNKDSKVSWSIKLIITITTAALLVLILYYHQLDMTMYYFRNSIEDWRVELTTRKVLLIALELLICAIHPMPRSYPQQIDSNGSETDSYSLSYTAIDVGLGLPMFLRLYLLGRCIMLHSHLVRHISLRSFGYLNQVSIDFYFLMKTYIKQWPTRCLMVFCITAFFIGSWSLRACDYKTTGEHMSMPDAMWLFIITFTTVGYGDLYPSTYCGRSIATLISLFGLVLSALLIAIVTHKLVLTREENYVHTFLLNTKLNAKRRNQAANVIKFAMKVWYLKRYAKYTSIEYFQTHRKLSRSIRYFQISKRKQRNLDDRCVGHIELMIIQRKTNVQTEKTIEQIATIKTDITEIKKQLNNMNHSMHTLQKTLHILLEKGIK